MNGIFMFYKQFQSLSENPEYEWIDFDKEQEEPFCLSFEAPSGSPYEGGFFRLSLEGLDSFPGTPPKVKFLTRIWHPLVEYSTGLVCQDAFKDGWTPKNGLHGFLHKLQEFMNPQTVETAINFEASAELEKQDGSFQLRAKELTQRHASY